MENNHIFLTNGARTPGHKDQRQMNQIRKCKSRNYKTLKGKYRVSLHNLKLGNGF